MIFFLKARKPSRERAEELLRNQKLAPEDIEVTANDTAQNNKSSDSVVATQSKPVASTVEPKAASKNARVKKTTKSKAEQTPSFSPEQKGIFEQVLRSGEKLALKIAAQTAGNAKDVGKFIESTILDDTFCIHYFETKLLGYKGWRWAVVLSANLYDDSADFTPENIRVTVLESALVPSDGALLAPDWIPFKDRLKPNDLTSTDELEYDPDDQRLEVFNQLKDEDISVLENLALERNRVLNAYGKEDLAARWYEGTHGPFTASTRVAQATCMSCAFYIPLAGDLGQLFGVCANAWSRDDARVVSSDHGCGMHSETDISKRSKRWNPADTVIDQIDNVDLEADDTDETNTEDVNIDNESENLETTETNTPEKNTESQLKNEPTE